MIWGLGGEARLQLLVEVGQRRGKAIWLLSLSSQVTNKSRVQGLLQEVRPMKRGHVECRRRGTVVAGCRVALTGNGGGDHVQWGRTLLVVLAVALLV